jgi:hypothetical protein
MLSLKSLFMAQQFTVSKAVPCCCNIACKVYKYVLVCPLAGKLPIYPTLGFCSVSRELSWVNWRYVLPFLTKILLCDKSQFENLLLEKCTIYWPISLLYLIKYSFKSGSYTIWTSET